VLNGVIQDNACHSDASQGIGYIDSGVGEIAGFIHLNSSVKVQNVMVCQNADGNSR
jgi:hypothetical protein